MSAGTLTLSPWFIASIFETMYALRSLNILIVSVVWLMCFIRVSNLDALESYIFSLASISSFVKFISYKFSSEISWMNLCTSVWDIGIYYAILNSFFIPLSSSAPVPVTNVLSFSLINLFFLSSAYSIYLITCKLNGYNPFFGASLGRNSLISHCMKAI